MDIDVAKSSFETRRTHTAHPLSQRIFSVMLEKQSNLCVSLDVVKSDELLAMAERLGPQVCMLKTHVDILQDFTPRLTQALRKLADRDGWILFEDRKFADIGQTVQQQYAGGIYQIAQWADVVNAHALPGPGVIQGLQAGVDLKGSARGLLLLAEMSSKGHLLDPAYQQKTLEMAVAAQDFVCGFISQHRLENTVPGFLYLTPGVHLSATGDSLGQQYRSPHQAIREQQCDIIIVGRGIIGNPDPKKIAEDYRVAAWTAYQDRLF